MPTLPRLSVRLHGGMTPQACVEQARAAEAAGIDAIWFAENPFARGIMAAAAACALATKTQSIGAGVFNPYGRHPTLIAMEIGALDELSGGRVRLGMGSGLGHAVERMGFSTKRSLTTLREAIVIVRALLRGEEVSYTGTVFNVQRVKLDYRARADIPIFMAARGPNAVKACGETGRRPDRLQHVRGGFRRQVRAQPPGSRPGRRARAARRAWCNTCHAFRGRIGTRPFAAPSARSPICCRPIGIWRRGCRTRRRR